jgi:VIT1/CCC1 family predicted Fe2+/Mn2+ transporter
MKKVFDKIQTSISAENFKNFVFGFQDGLVTTYILLTGIAIVVIFNPVLLIITLLAEIASGAISMAFGSYISSKTKNEFLSQIKISSARNIEINRIFNNQKLTEEEFNKLDTFFKDNPNIWKKFRRVNYHKKKDPVNNALLMGGAFILGGIIPLIPYLVPTPVWSFLIATIASFSGLFIIGILRKYFGKSKKHWIRPALEMVLLGVLAVVIIEIYLYFISLTYGLIIGA